MHLSLRLMGASFALLFAFLGSEVAHAEPETGKEAPASDLRPPRRVGDLSPSYPEALVGSGRTATVRLRLDIDTDGTVTQASILEGAPDFDEAALAFARQLRFDPATRAGKPIPARIPFRVDFRDPGKPAQAPEEPSPAIVPGPAAPPASPSVEPPPTATAEPTVQEVQVVGERPASEPTRRVLGEQELKRMPGTGGDPMRAIEAMPGVARPPAMSGILVVRGSAPRDTQAFVDGMPIPLAYHFGGLTSVIPADLLSRIDFLPGNYGPEYGRGNGGIIELGLRSPRSDRPGGIFQIDAYDARLVAETPLGKNTRVLIAGRRSWIDAWFGPLVKSASFSVPAAPVYYDGQVVVEHDFGEKTSARLVFGLSDDRFSAFSSGASGADPSPGGALDLVTSFGFVQARLTTKPFEGTKITQLVSYTHGYLRMNVLGILDDEHDHLFQARTDVRQRIAKGLSAFGGVDVTHVIYNVDLRIPNAANPADGSSGVYPPLFGQRLRTLHGEGTTVRPAGYLGLSLEPSSSALIVPSFRLDYAEDTGRTTFDPRLMARWDVVSGERPNGERLPRTTLKGAVGSYSSPPQYSQSLPPWGQAGLLVQRSYQATLGVEQELYPGVNLSVEGFAKWLDRLVVRNETNTTASGGKFENTGQGRVLGAEVLLKAQPRGPFFGFLSYTLSRSERRDSESLPFALFQYDQTHILTAMAGVKLGTWEFGARFRYVTGLPYTSVLGSNYDLDAGTYSPIASKVPFTARMDPFHQLDLRVDKTWIQRKSFKFSTYLDVRNVYNYRSPEGMQYNARYTQSQPVGGLPILPIVGIRGEL